MAQLWRLSRLAPWGTGDLELGELQLWAAGSRLDVGATITASVAPSSGALTDLADNDATTRAVFTAAQRHNVTWIMFDMGSDVPDVDQVKIGLGLTKAKSLRWFSIEKFDSGAWVDVSFNTVVGGRVGSVIYTAPEALVSVSRFVCDYLRVLVTRWVTNNQIVSHGLYETSGLTGGGEIRLQEIQFYDHADTKHPTSSLTSNSAPSPFTAVASSEHVSGSFSAWRAFDDVANDSNRWIGLSTYAGDQHITVKLDQDIDLVRFRLAPDGAVSAGYYILSFDILGSTTGAFAGEERLLHRHVNDGVWTGGTYRDFTVNAAGSVGTESVAEDRQTFDAGVDPMPGLFEFETPALTMLYAGATLSNNDNLEGLGFIEGTVKIEADPDDEDVPDIPVHRLVRLYRDLDGKYVKSAYSDGTTGVYIFENLNMDFTYTVISYDSTHSYRAVVADGVTPVLS